MNMSLLYLCGYLAAMSPFLAIVAILAHYCLRRGMSKARKWRRRTASSFCPSATALGIVLLFVQILYRPTVSYVLEVKQDEETKDDDQGDSETLTRQLGFQLKRIRRGEPVDRLVLRL
jgi:hypothetical protein